MKKIFVSLSLLLAAGVPAVFANAGPEPGKQVLELFKKEFSTAESVTWTKQEEYDKATFILGGRRAVAYFNEDGELEGCIRDIFFDQLPLAVMTAVDKKYSDAEIIDVREVSNVEGTTYRIRLNSNKKKFSIKVDAAGNISDIQKIVKK